MRNNKSELEYNMKIELYSIIESLINLVQYVYLICSLFYLLFIIKLFNTTLTHKCNYIIIMI